MSSILMWGVKLDVMPDGNGWVIKGTSTQVMEGMTDGEVIESVNLAQVDASDGNSCFYGYVMGAADISSVGFTQDEIERGRVRAEAILAREGYTGPIQFHLLDCTDTLFRSGSMLAFNERLEAVAGDLYVALKKATYGLELVESHLLDGPKNDMKDSRALLERLESDVDDSDSDARAPRR